MTTSFRLKTLARLCAVALSTIAALDSAVGAPVTLTSSTDVTRGAVAVTTTMGEFPYENYYAVSHLIDQSGLSSPYVSGLTAFDGYVRKARQLGGFGTQWLSNNVSTGFLSFDLGSAYNIDGLALFKLGEDYSSNITRLKVYADNDSDATNGNAGLLFDSGTFDPDDFGTHAFSFSSAANTRYLDIEIVSNGRTDASGAGEVVFRQSLDAPVAPAADVPEPQSFALAGLGLLALGVTRRRVTKR